MVAILSGFDSRRAVWKKMSSGINESAVSAVAVDPVQPGLVVAGTDKAAYFSKDSGRSFQSIPRLSGEFSKINDIHFDPWERGAVYLATDNGLYAGNIGQNTWQRVFAGRDADARISFAVLTDQENIYVGTADGLRYKERGEVDWRSFPGELSMGPVYRLAVDDRFLYAVTGTHLYRVDRQDGAARKIFTAGLSQDENGMENGTEVEGFVSVRLIKDLGILTDPGPLLFLASERGIFFSIDRGDSWTRIPGDGLPLKDITALTVTGGRENSHGAQVQPGPVEAPALYGAGPEESLPADGLPAPYSENTFTGQIYAATTEGVFVQEGRHWPRLYAGMETNTVNDLSVDGRGNVYAATDKGVFLLPSGEAVASQSSVVSGQFSETTSMNSTNSINYNEIAARFTGEPDVRKVQKLAIRYADVSKRKIDNWKRQARARAFVPVMSIGLDRASTNLYHWDSGQNPDAIIKGKEFIDWDVSFSWDFADFVWSSDQTSIDSRSKLMVELREDILDQVTRLYFERRRTQIEAAAGDWDPQVRMEKEMRIEELTALIDAMTGGEFSRLLAERAASE